MFIAGFPAGPWGTNCYVVATGPGAECVVIDPGMDSTDGVRIASARGRASDPDPRRWAIRVARHALAVADE